MPRESFAVEVAVFAPLRKTYHYLQDADNWREPAVVGARVKVPFGRGVRIGVVLALVPPSSAGVRRLKTVIELIDDTPVIGAPMMRLARWAADYYQHPIGEVLAATLPGPLRRGRTPALRQTVEWVVTGPDAVTKLRNAPRQSALLELIGNRPATAADFEALDFDWRRALHELEKKGCVMRRAQVSSRRPGIVCGAPVVELNAGQKAAIQRLNSAFGSFRAHLLHGVTGSGKTEVYLAVIHTALDRDLTALLLVPEIILTQQMVVRLEQRFGDAVAVLHSGLTERERTLAWLRCRDGQVKVLMGTRSAVWAPLPRLGVVIVDEEHDGSFKQQDGFRYNARDVAIMRAQHARVPIVLGTATPSLEACLNVEKKKFKYISLPQRAGTAQMPKISCIDVRGLRLTGGLSDVLCRAIGARVERGEQALLFLNRRGFAPVALCHQCGWVAKCERCDANLVWHMQRDALICHHCGAEKKPQRIAPCCREPDLVPIGVGTERVEQALTEMFPGKVIARIDRDTMRRKRAMTDTIAAIRDGSVDILVGTQMLAKGHDFSRVTLVGIVTADSQLFSLDFRAEEKLAQMIIQVAGRAGRGTATGEVLIQTHHPHHELLQTLITAGYDRFAQRALEERRRAGLPPFVPMALIRAEAPKPQIPQKFLAALVAKCKTREIPGLEILGPIPAAMEKKAGRYRAQVMITARSRRVLAVTVKSLIDASDDVPARRNVRWSIDIDPHDTM
ncbi:MAG: primosomal protein N' [Proteobacteria bacterium]|nr:MAG: primosomal protein N' [Pseudomonadota bacterium]